MAGDADRDPSEALSRASVFPVRTVPPPSVPPESEREAAPSSAFDGEDFLFHLYRGSELLQDNCVEQAKEELERALRFQPRDIEGQGLLGVVYFRLGLYPRAIGIYEELARACPDEITPKVNLALCYLKTGQQHSARDVLEAVIQREPEHVRAWGYYGLALERLGEYEKAQAAFDRAGQPQLARRMTQILDQSRPSPDAAEAERQRYEVRRVAADAALELDAKPDAPFSTAEEAGDLEPVRSSRWRAVEPGEETVPPAPKRRSSVPSRLGGLSMPVVSDPSELLPATIRNPMTSIPIGVSGTPSAFVAAISVTPPAAAERVTLSGTMALVRVEVAFAVRNDALRAVQPDREPFRWGALRRRTRGHDTDEPFGGPASPWSVLEGTGTVAVAAAEGRFIAALELGGEFVYLREGRLLGFDSSARH
jgi:Flp pilus assembly protein TadD